MNIRRLEKAEESDSVSDAELACAAQRGDKRAFVQIVVRHQAMVCGIALGILGDFALSEDVGQEAFLTAWRKIHELREPDRLRAWLGQIARNAARGQVRARKRHDPLDERLELPDESPTPDQAAASEEEAALVRQSLAKLPENYRMALVLYYREGQSVRAVAETLGISEDAVRQRLARGREMCRDRISKLIETVLVRKRPTAVFTMSIAVAIGALATPAAVGGTVFAPSTGVGTSAATSTKTVLSTIMTASKGFLLSMALVAVLCVPVGYSLRTDAVTATVPSVPDATERIKTPHPKAPPDFEDSALFAEWRSLHVQYGTNAQAMPEMYKAIIGIKDSFHRQALASALFSEWAQVDPAGGMSFFLAKEHWRGERQQFFREWLAVDPHTAAAGLMIAGQGWENIAHECLTEIAQSAPDQLPNIVSRLPKPESFWDSKVRDAFAMLAQGGVNSAIAATETLTGPNRDQALAGIARTWGQSDLNAAVTWAKGLPGETDRDEIIRNAVMGKATVDPKPALEALGIVPGGGKEGHFASTTGARVLSGAANTDFDGTVAWVASHPGRLGNEDLIGLADTVTERLNADPAGFLSSHAADGTLGLLVPALSSALLNGSSGNRSPVWDWLNTQPDSEAIQSLKEQVLNSAARQDPMLALKLGSDLPNTPEGDRQAKSLANSLFNGGSMLGRFDQCFAAAPERLQTALLESAFSLLGNITLSNPQSWVAKLPLLPPADRMQGTESLARAWATQAPSETIAWANSLPSGETQNAAAAAIVSGWATKDVQGAAGWVATLPNGPERDRSAGAFVLSVADQFPQEAWQWALSINDSALRDLAATQVVQFMAGRDPATARQWINSGPFTDDTRQKLHAALQKPAASH
ncbi:MAG TPA: sigma-70 family RNA polymerase sigma factor [Candidatus Dormibacteraeota bacterium]|nr:sigma-70 family RNA polymerase sigma factor [Candidatus Dormibacteraeota bacterium]